MFAAMKRLWEGQKPVKHSQGKRSTFRPALEALEDRLVPSQLTVFNTADSGVGSLRAAVNVANNDSQHNVSDTINFAPYLRGHSIYLNTPVVLDGGKGAITINGNGINTQINGTYDAFGITHGTTVQMNNVFISDCHGASHGGAIANGGTLILHGCEFDDNSAVGFGGAIYNTGSLTTSNCTYYGDKCFVSGGAIYNLGTVNVYDCDFEKDSSGEGGAICNDHSGVLYVLSEGNKFANNYSTKSTGGAIFNDGFAIVVGSSFVHNTSATAGGAIGNYGNITVTNDTFTGNQAKFNGGGVFSGPGASWNIHANWHGNTAGGKGPNFYLYESGGRAKVG